MTSASTKITIHVIVIWLLYTVTQWFLFHKDALECTIGIDWPAVQRMKQKHLKWTLLFPHLIRSYVVSRQNDITNDAYTKRMDYQCYMDIYKHCVKCIREKKIIIIKRYSRKMCIYHTYIRTRSLFAAFKMIYINLLFININHKGLLRYGLKYTNTYSRITSYYVNARERENVKEIRI